MHFPMVFTIKSMLMLTGRAAASRHILSPKALTLFEANAARSSIQPLEAHGYWHRLRVRSERVAMRGGQEKESTKERHEAAYEYTNMSLEAKIVRSEKMIKEVDREMENAKQCLLDPDMDKLIHWQTRIEVLRAKKSMLQTERLYLLDEFFAQSSPKEKTEGSRDHQTCTSPDEA
mmetsp:Transcript_38239/g.120413  ORF Transcript_38239/g.120413 Transcript_38239/m.120413 type:complete len:175 (-) Transcript_38239:231-755(-)